MALSKRLKYEIFARDNYTCQACGAKAPDVELTVDHVIPKSLGGTDDPSNLQTLCKDCNAGKSSSHPDASRVAAVDQKAAQWADAMKHVAERERQDLVRSGEFINEFDKYWCTWTNGLDDPLQRPDSWEQSVLSMRDAGMDMDGLHEAVRIAMAAKHIKNRDTWRYFCGIVWRRLKQRQQAARELLSAPSAPAPAPAQPDSAKAAELGRAYAEAYEDMDRLAQTLEEETIAYWLVEHAYLEGNVFHRVQSFCVPPCELLEALFNERISGHERDSAIKQTRDQGDPTFCVWCCREEADAHNPRSSGGEA